MIITRSGLTIRCARCDSEVSHFAAAFDPVKAMWVGTAFCHGDSAAVAVPDRLSEATVFKRRAPYAHGIRSVPACAGTERKSAADRQTIRSVVERKSAADRQTKPAREQAGASA